MSAWLGHGPLTDERNKHGLTLKIKKFRQPFESQSSLPLVAACSLSLLFHGQNRYSQLPVFSASTSGTSDFYEQTQQGPSLSRPRSKLCNPDLLSFSIRDCRSKFLLCLFWLVGNVVVVTSTSDSRFVSHRCRLCRLCGTSNIVSTHKQL